MVNEDASGALQSSSFDPAVYEEDWNAAWQRIVGKGKQATCEQVFLVARELLG
jgi:hypothetical protein